MREGRNSLLWQIVVMINLSVETCLSSSYCCCYFPPFIINTFCTSFHTDQSQQLVPARYRNTSSSMYSLISMLLKVFVTKS